MANKTVVLSNYFLNGTANLTLLLLNPTNGSIGNGAGDTLTAGSNGLFSAVVTEAITGWWNVVVLDGSTVLAEGGKVYFQSDSVGTYIVDDATHAADAVLDEAYADHNLAGTIGKLLNTIRKANLAIEGVVSNAITPTTLTFSSDISATTSAYAHAVLLFVSGPLAGENSPIVSYTSTNGVFVLEEPLTAAPSNGDEFVVVAASHVHSVAEIQSGLATTTQLTTVENKIDVIDDYIDTEVAAIKAKTDNLPSDPADASDITAAFSEIKGTGWSSTTDTLKEIADAAGAGHIMVTPVVAQVPVRVVGTNIETFIGDLSDITVGIFSGSDPVDLSGFGDLEVCVQSKTGTDLDFVEMADLTISGTDSNYVSWTPDGPSVANEGRYKWSLRKTSNKQVIAYGAWIIVDAALEDVGS